MGNFGGGAGRFGSDFDGPDANGGCCFMAERDFEAVNAVDGGVPGGSATQGRDFSIWNKTHVHQVVLNVFREVECDQDPAFTHRQIAEHAHLTNPVVPPEPAGQQKNTTGMVVFKYTAKLATAAILVLGDF